MQSAFERCIPAAVTRVINNTTTYILFTRYANSEIEIRNIMLNVHFQKISIPTLRKVIGNSEGEGDLKRQNF